MLAACSVQYGGSYETAKFSHNTADGLTMVGVGMSVAMVRRGRSASAAGATQLQLLLGCVTRCRSTAGKLARAACRLPSTGATSTDTLPPTLPHR